MSQVPPTGPSGGRPPPRTDEDVQYWYLQAAVMALPQPEERTARPLAFPSSTVTIVEMPGAVSRERVEIRERINTNQNSLLKFVKKHPLLSAGYVLAVGMLLFAFHNIGMTVLGHTHMTIEHARFAVEGVMSVMLLYYGVYLINMARRSALKDELEAKIDQLAKSDAIRKADASLDVHQARAYANTVAINANAEQSRQNLLKVREEYRDDLMNLWEKGRLLEGLLMQLEAFLHEIGQKINPHFAKNVLDTSFSMRKQAHLLLLDEIPLGEQIKSEIPKMVSFPDAPSEQAAKRQEIQKQIVEGQKGLFQKLGTFISQNPISALVMTAGVLITVIAGPMAVTWLFGDKSLYMIGTLGLEAICGFVIYGLSMIYEGHNSAAINRLKKKLRELDDTQPEQVRKIEAQRAHYERIIQVAQEQGRVRAEQILKIRELQDTLSSERVKAVRSHDQVDACLEEVTSLISSLMISTPPPSPRSETGSQLSFDEIMEQFARLNRS